MTDAVELTAERGKTHGDWMIQSAVAQTLKRFVRETPNWPMMSPHERESVEMILVKISRICCGNPGEPDHWNDIGGYAHLGKDGHQ